MCSLGLSGAASSRKNLPLRLIDEIPVLAVLGARARKGLQFATPRSCESRKPTESQPSLKTFGAWECLWK